MRDFMLEKSAWRPADLLAVYFVGKIADAGAAHFGTPFRDHFLVHLPHANHPEIHSCALLFDDVASYRQCARSILPHDVHTVLSFTHR